MGNPPKTSRVPPHPTRRSAPSHPRPIALQRILPINNQQRSADVDLDELTPNRIEGRYPADLSDIATARIESLLDAASHVVNRARSANAHTSPTSRP